MLRRNLTSLRKHHTQRSDVILETRIKESKINLMSKEKITQAKFKQFMNFIFYKWGNCYFISKVIVVSNIGKDAWDSVSAITRVKPLRSFTLKLYSMLCRRRGASARETFENRLQGLMIGMYCDVSFAKKQLIELLKGMDDSQGLFLNQFYAYFCSVGSQ